MVQNFIILFCFLIYVTAKVIYLLTVFSSALLTLALSAGNFQCTSKKGQQSLFFQEGDMSAEKQYNFNQHHDSVSNLCGAKDTCFDDLGLSEFALTNSPYETRLSDWISELSSEQSGINYNQDCNSVESDLCHLTWTPDDSNRWECPCFLWDMN